MPRQQTRTKAPDFVDLVVIAEQICPRGPLLMADAGKPPYLSPQTIVDELRRRGLSIAEDDVTGVAGLPETWTPAQIRKVLVSA